MALNLLHSPLLQIMVKAGPAGADNLRTRIFKLKINFSIEGCHMYSRVKSSRTLLQLTVFLFSYFELEDGLQVIPTA